MIIFCHILVPIPGHEQDLPDNHISVEKRSKEAERLVRVRVIELGDKTMYIIQWKLQRTPWDQPLYPLLRSFPFLRG